MIYYDSSALTFSWRSFNLLAFIAKHISLEILKNEPKCGSFMWILDFKLKLDGSRMNWQVA